MTVSLISPPSSAALVPQTTPSVHDSSPIDGVSALLESYGSVPTPANYAPNPEVRTKFSYTSSVFTTELTGDCVFFLLSRVAFLNLRSTPLGC